MINKIVNAIQKARSENPINSLLLNNTISSGLNDFLFFIKPEITLENTSIQLKEILKMVLDKLDEHSLKINNVRVINASYLEKHNIIADHYGVIHKLTSDIRSTITEEGKARFETLYKISFEEARIFGGFEFLKEFPHFSATGLSFLWQNTPFEKLSSGAYVQKLSFDGKAVFLVDGFHPRQIEHYTAPGKTIVSMHLSGNTSWKIARNNLIGKTNPAEAMPGSIRRELFDRKDIFGLSQISYSLNGVHLSAGSIEGLAELMRYNSDFENNVIQQISDYAFGEKLLETFGELKTKELLTNPLIKHNDKVISAFDLTEELDSDECLAVLKSYVQ